MQSKDKKDKKKFQRLVSFAHFLHDEIEEGDGVFDPQVFGEILGHIAHVSGIFLLQVSIKVITERSLGADGLRGILDPDVNEVQKLLGEKL